jgi:hypothetical protein
MKESLLPWGQFYAFYYKLKRRCLRGGGCPTGFPDSYFYFNKAMAKMHWVWTDPDKISSAAAGRQYPILRRQKNGV